jgi:PKD repeat protein
MNGKRSILAIMIALIFMISISTTTLAAKPTADFKANVVSGTAPLNVQFTSTSTGSPTSYMWVFEPQTSSDWNSHHAVTAVHTFKKAGVYTISLIVTNKDGSTTITKKGYITVKAQATKPTVDFTANKVTGKAPLSVQFTSKTTGNPTDYYWVFEPQTSSDWNSHHAVTAVHTFKKPGTYTISLSCKNAAGATTATKRAYIIVK